MALTKYRYTGDSTKTYFFYFDPAKLKYSITAANLGLVPADGTETGGSCIWRGSPRSRKVIARQVALRDTGTGKFTRYPCGTVAAYNALANATGYTISLKRGEVNNDF